MFSYLTPDCPVVFVPGAPGSTVVSIDLVLDSETGTRVEVCYPNPTPEC